MSHGATGVGAVMDNVLMRHSPLPLPAGVQPRTTVLTSVDSVDTVDTVDSVDIATNAVHTLCVRA